MSGLFLPASDWMSGYTGNSARVEIVGDGEIGLVIGEEEDGESDAGLVESKLRFLTRAYDR